MTTAVMNPYEQPRNPMAVRSSTSIESNRVVAEIQAAVMLARKFKRSPKDCVDKILNECQRKSLAEVALYNYSRGGTDITGPSIRLAETVARNWENIDFGIKELSQTEGQSELMAYAWDLETNVRQTKVFIVEHIRYTKKGTKVLSDPRDIYETVANNGARRLRACILGVIPRDVIDAAVEQCEATMKANADTSPEAIKKMLDVFKPYGVTKKMIEARIQRRIESITASQFVNLRKIFTSLKDNMSAASDWFDIDGQGVDDDPGLSRADMELVATFDENTKELPHIDTFLSIGAARQDMTVEQAKVAIMRDGSLDVMVENYRKWEAGQAAQKKKPQETNKPEQPQQPTGPESDPNFDASWDPRTADYRGRYDQWMIDVMQRVYKEMGLTESWKSGVQLHKLIRPEQEPAQEEPKDENKPYEVPTEVLERFNEIWAQGNENAKEAACRSVGCEEVRNGVNDLMGYKRPPAEKIDQFVTFYEDCMARMPGAKEDNAPFEKF